MTQAEKSFSAHPVNLTNDVCLKLFNCYADH